MEKKQVVQYVIGCCMALIMFLAAAYFGGLFQKTDKTEIFGTLSDCFFFPAVFMGGIGALSWISHMGNFDMLSYGFHMVFQKLLHPHTMPEKYYEYKLRRNEDKKGWLKHYLVIGLVCLAASCICILFYI